MTCSVDMQCMVSYIKWYKKLQNGKKQQTKNKHNISFQYDSNQILQQQIIILALIFSGTFDAMKTGVSKTNPYLLEIQVKLLNYD